MSPLMLNMHPNVSDVNSAVTFMKPYNSDVAMEHWMLTNGAHVLCGIRRCDSVPADTKMHYS